MESDERNGIIEGKMIGINVVFIVAAPAQKHTYSKAIMMSWARNNDSLTVP